MSVCSNASLPYWYLGSFHSRNSGINFFLISSRHNMSRMHCSSLIILLVFISFINFIKWYFSYYWISLFWFHEVFLFDFLFSVVRNEGKNIQDINKLINVLNCLAEQTSTAMKQSVYENYSVFIEAAKDVAVLESDMHQMHHLLNEQKRLLQCLQERSIFGNSSHYPDSETATTPVIYEPQKLG